jgi:sodium/hydrogen antiporter
VQVPPLVPATSTSFDDVALVFGALLVAGALSAGIMRRSLLSMVPVYVLAGYLLGSDGFDVLHFSPSSEFVTELAAVALIVILFRDGLEVEGELLQRAWRLPARKLVIAMPVTACVVALAAHWIVGLDWTYAFLVGALLSPTDPILTSGVVTNPRVPRIIRHSLNLESGMNDGLALAPVLAFAAALDVSESNFVWWKFVIQDIGLGLAYGIAVGWLASIALPRGTYAKETMPAYQRTLYGLGVAFLAYGIAVMPPHGNGFIAVFVCAITLGVRRPDMRAWFEERSEELVEIVKLGVFVVFGSVLTFDALSNDGWAALALAAVTLLVARPVAIWIALWRTGLDIPTKAFMAWFGPKGIATVTFSLIVLSKSIPDGERVFDLAALVVVCSVFAHSLTDHPGSEWIARRSERAPAEAGAGAQRGQAASEYAGSEPGSDASAGA